MLPIINFPVTLENLPRVANNLPLVPIGNDIRGFQEHYILCGCVGVFLFL